MASRTDSQEQVDRTILLLYEAAAETGSQASAAWASAGDALRRLVGAETGSLYLGDPRAGRVEQIFASALPQASVEAHARHFHALDPWTVPTMARSARMPMRAILGSEVIEDAAYRRTEWYTDFARDLGLFHLIGTIVPLGAEAGAAPLGLHRPDAAGPFSTDDRRLLDRVLPHLRQALRLRVRLGGLPRTESGVAALEGLRDPALVVDADLHVLRANAAAAAMAAQGEGILLQRNGHAGLILRAEATTTTAALAAEVARCALGGGEGSALALPRQGRGPLAALVSPIPARFAAPGREQAPLVLILLRDPSGMALPSVQALVSLFGMTRAEAAVARALAAGETMEAVAAGRGVGPATVRSQARTACQKTGAATLRDLARILATLGRG